MPGTKNLFQSLPKGSCMCWGALLPLSQAVCNSALAFTSCFFRASRSAEVESLGSFQVFPEHEHSSEYVCVLPDYQEYVSYSKPLQTSHSVACALKYWVSLLFALNVTYYLREQQLRYKILACECYWQMPPREQLALSQFQELGEIKISLPRRYQAGQSKWLGFFVNEVISAFCSTRYVSCYIQSYCWTREGFGTRVN